MRISLLPRTGARHSQPKLSARPLRVRVAKDSDFFSLG
jgi:hypothetical protein